MIRLILPVEPAILATEGAERTKKDCEAYDACPADYISGNFVLLRSIYGSKEVKLSLLVAQFYKCCYCEVKFGASSPGDIEHYRPKKCVRQDMSSEEERPGYYWLAYSWSNLLVACEKCNRECKRTQFPLANPEKRARCHRNSIADEVPLLIHPALEDPQKHIRFRKDAPEGLTCAGITTIRVLNLDTRPELVEVRVKKFKRLARLLDAYRNSSKDASDPVWSAWRADALRDFEEEMHPNSEFSAMASALLSNQLE
ncbi:MAG TPA: hypothetical protein VGS07_17785 [Thermoanaerobaculia bacterium]|jgi:uncharacterized protein (TIGR02646 family)|nr:hypothetical protein [Thermoanaerobaculia bacterium]